MPECRRLPRAVACDYSDKPWKHGRICVQYSLCWGLLALLVGYVLDPLLSTVVSVPDRRSGEAVLTVVLLVTVLAGVVTAAALTRTRRRVAGHSSRGAGSTGDRHRVRSGGRSAGT